MDVKFDIFDLYWKIWRIMGTNPPQSSSYGLRPIYLIYSVMLNFFLTFYFPLSLIIGLISLSQLKDILENITMGSTIVALSLKFLCITIKRRQILEIEDIARKLNMNTTEDFEVKSSLRRLLKRCRLIINIYLWLYAAVCVSAGLSTIFYNERRLIYPAWFPFDWKQSTSTYVALSLYQVIGCSIQACSNLACDTYPPVALCLLTGYIRILSIRVQKIGIDKSKTSAENHRDLLNCIQGHKDILKLYKLIQNAISPGTCVQIFVSSINMCISIVVILFFIDEIFQYAYFIAYSMAIPLEIYLTCYYGTALTEEGNNLSNAIYSCNWIEQDKLFRQDLRIFLENSLKIMQMKAGGLTTISLETFMAAVRGAYSLFAILRISI